MFLASLPVVVSGATLDSLNAIRARGCGGRPGVESPFTIDAELNRVALELSRDANLREALARVGYRAKHTTSIVVKNALTQESLRRVLNDQFCADVVDPTFKRAGIVERDGDTWIALAAPFETPSAAETAATIQRVHELINEARSHKRRCGNKVYRAANPLRLVPTLNKAALRHARDMARHSFMDHRGSDGSLPAQRITSAGYSWRSVGENVAQGSASAERAVEDWLSSPGHCANLMNRDFTDTGIAFVVDSKSAAGIYWAQVFATPR